MHHWEMLRRAAKRGALVLILITSTIGEARGEIELISKADPIPDTNGHSLPLSMSANGRYVVLLSDATNLVPGQVDRNASHDTFLLDRVAVTATLLTHSAGFPNTAGSASPFNLLTAEI
ncbi:MAG TPA: hypothetical protein VG477_19145, partial [Thermoanaerobaculia bacterium]|nr:hypothetical protein [Thermoanaerobaculia bacterium]